MTKLSYCALQVKKYDNDRYLGSLFAKEQERERLFALYAFNIELAAVAENTKEEMAGFIRLQWWREKIADLYQGKIAHHEVLKALKEAIDKTCLSKELLEAMISAREFELEKRAPADLAEYLDYAKNISLPLFQLVAQALGVKIPEQYNKLAVAYSIIGHLRAAKFYLKNNRIIFPKTMLEAYGLTEEDVFCGSEKMIPLVKELVSLAEKNLNENVTPQVLPLLLCYTAAKHFLNKIKKANYNIFAKDLEKNRFLLQLKLFFRALRVKKADGL